MLLSFTLFTKAGDRMRCKSLKAAFPHTLPILAGFSFLGLAYGIYMNTAGFSFIYPMFMSTLIFGGSLGFPAVCRFRHAHRVLPAECFRISGQPRHPGIDLHSGDRRTSCLEAEYAALHFR